MKQTTLEAARMVILEISLQVVTLATRAHLRTVAALAGSILLLTGPGAALARSVPFSDETVIGDFGNANAIFVSSADVDGDGDIDVLGAAPLANDILWWENTAGDGSTWTEHVVDGNFSGARSVSSADVDGDGDTDILGASGADFISWWENTAGDGSTWTEHTVAESFTTTRSVSSADVDGDGDLDILGTSSGLDDIAWWENTAGDGSAWTKHTIDNSFDGACSVSTADVDGDGDIDVLGAAEGAGDITWWENTAGDGSTWTKDTVDGDFSGAQWVSSADVDGDGDMDILGAARFADDITWWENTAGDGAAWTEHSIDSAFDGATSVSSADVDGDGDVDILGAAWNLDDIAWWENIAGDGSTWSEHTVAGDFDGAISVASADVDGDGHVDILGAAQLAGDFAWWRNDTIHRSAAFPAAGENTVAPSFDGASSVASADVDGDGDLDILGSSLSLDAIAWWENAAGDGSTWTEHVVDSDFDFPLSVSSADVDGDGDTDILGAAQLASEIVWWENAAGDGSTWTKRVVDGTFSGASVSSADVDGDGDTDILGAAYLLNEITWWENTAGDGSVWTEHALDGSFDGASSVSSADVDGDGDIDILGAAYFDDDITWWENTAGDGSAWTERTVDGSFDGAQSVSSADVDGDGDVDILGAATFDDDITWWENTAGDGSAWTEHSVDGDFDGARSVSSADLDGDGDVDILGAAYFADDITWWENTAGDGSAWTAHPVDSDFNGARSVASADVDGDGDIDILAASDTDDDVTWWENLGGQFALATVDTAPSTLLEGDTQAVLAITATHNGRSGDTSIELTTLELRFEQGSGVPLTTGEANALVASLFIYRDNFSGSFEIAADTLVETVTELNLTAGVQTVSFTDGDSFARVQHGTPRTFFAVIEAATGGAAQSPNQFRVTHLTQSSTAEDRQHDLPLDLEYAANVSSTTLTIVALTPTPTATPTSTPTDTPTSTPTSTPTDTSTSTPTSTPTETPTPSVTPTPTATGTATILAPLLDSFSSYKVKRNRDGERFYAFGPATLTDEFRSADYFFRKLTTIALPAAVNGEATIDAMTHLTELSVRAAKGTPRFEGVEGIRVVNSCTDVFLEVNKPVSLLMPTNLHLSGPIAAPDEGSHNVDHFLCYRARSEDRLPRGIQVEVADSFQSRRYDLKKITKLCVPVAVAENPAASSEIQSGPQRGEPKPVVPASIRNPEHHLVCYRAKLARNFIPQDGCGALDESDRGTEIDPRQARHDKIVGFHATSTFGAAILDTTRELDVCIPSAMYP